MKSKKIFYTEYSYILGLVLLAIGTALMTKADFGLSMVVAPAYLIHLAVSNFLPFFTFGMAEYCFQAVLILLLCVLMRKFKISYLFSFITAVLYGLLLDGALLLLGFVQSIIVIRIIFFIVGLFTVSFSVSLLFHSYISPEAYELFVMEFSKKTGKDIRKVKTVYDCISCILAIILSFSFFGFGVFKGVWYGTIINALINGYVIGFFSKLLEKNFCFKDKFKFRSFFESN